MLHDLDFNMSNLFVFDISKLIRAQDQFQFNGIQHDLPLFFLTKGRSQSQGSLCDLDSD